MIAYSVDLAAELERVGISSAEYIFSTSTTDRHWKAIIEAVAPRSRIGVVDDREPIDGRALKQKPASLHWELRSPAYCLELRYDRTASTS